MSGAISAFGQKSLLDFICGGAGAVTQPSERWVGVAWGTPTSIGGSEINTSMGYMRQSATFGAAASPAGSCSLVAAATFSRFSSACSIVGLQLWDGSGTGASMLLYATLQTARTVGVGDSLVINTLGITLP
jgi:hypothetical protein